MIALDLESGLLGGESTSSSSESEEEEEEEGSVLDTSRPDSARPSPSKADEEATPTLAPLGRNKPGGKEGKEDCPTDNSQSGSSILRLLRTISKSFQSTYCM